MCQYSTAGNTDPVQALQYTLALLTMDRPTQVKGQQMWTFDAVLLCNIDISVRLLQHITHTGMDKVDTQAVFPRYSTVWGLKAVNPELNLVALQRSKN